MTASFDIICIGSVLWDVIGRAPVDMRHGSDVGGRITRLPGGVALNIAMTLAQRGMRPALLSHVGQDPEGDALIAACKSYDMVTDYVMRSPRPTDQYMAVEGTNGLIAAVADAHSLEDAGDVILRPLNDARIATPDAPYQGFIALDGNLTPALLAQIAHDPAFAAADLRVAPASPGKADRLAPFVTHGRGTLYVNLDEASTLAGLPTDNIETAACALLDQGAARVVITNGATQVCDASNAGVIFATPPKVHARRVTGAGDTFMAAHIVAESKGAPRDVALQEAADVAARYVSGE